MTLTKTNVFPEIAAVINTFNFESISAERKIILQPLVDYIQRNVNAADCQQH